ncbi:hypothetical protein GCM10010992_10920 [Cloacibacterium rupense]|uniref:Uncharacterized protein n=1 Tax=Cloacibacterium rupense TaxID=517423 RepID=A0ABQ2NJ27_9FLAO|nr:hypothetical protein GCM10010992_10920 [Cloacibacterium rupense]
MKKYNLKFLIGLIVSFIGSVIAITLSMEKDTTFALSRAIFSCFFMSILFYLVFIYKDKYK